jgi:hypothetical protein
MSDKPTKFRHSYYKLAKAEFTTIRGRGQFKKLKIGNTVWVETPTERFEAMIICLELKRVADMGLAFLKADAEYPGFVIESPMDFVTLLNSFRAPAWTQVTLDSELTIITLKKII